MEKVDLLSIAISTGPYEEFTKSIIECAKSKTKSYSCIANVHMLVEAYFDRHFARVVRNAHIITPDGQPLAWALKKLYGIQQDRVAGMDLLPDLLRAASTNKLSVYLYGGEEEMLKDAVRYLNNNYPNLIIAGHYSPPFEKTLSKKEEKIAIQKINDSKANLVFVVLGCPKQEKWMAHMEGKLNAFAVGVGGALPVLIGRMRRAPKFMQDSGLEWLYRLGQEPKRLFKRYAMTNSVFIYLLIKEYFRLKLQREKLPTRTVTKASLNKNKMSKEMYLDN